ncbi:hypothetical protein [Variovorax rhizosphaerae]|uniref:DUF2946 domain-containing protein n=1 Tax=Variovorax rhizosphaerae TaxID=1836200 RepID=A0ABU8WXZ9_9BURK
MSLFRALLLWAVMLSVPFQGYAAASMLYCATTDTPLSESLAVASAASHGHDDHSSAAPKASASHDHHEHDAGDDGSAHKCGTCGACHTVALTSAIPAVPYGVLPPADLAEPIIAVAELAPRVLDKPPRA